MNLLEEFCHHYHNPCHHSHRHHRNHSHDCADQNRNLLEELRYHHYHIHRHNFQNPCHHSLHHHRNHSHN